MQNYETSFRLAQFYFDIANGPVPESQASLGAWVNNKKIPINCPGVFGYTTDNYIDDVDWVNMRKSNSGNFFFKTPEEVIREFFHLLSIIEEEKGEEELARLQAYHQDPSW